MTWQPSDSKEWTVADQREWQRQQDLRRLIELIHLTITSAEQEEARQRADRRRRRHLTVVKESA